MLEEVRSVVATLEGLVRDFDSRGADRPHAVQLTDLFARVEHLGETGKALAAQAAAETGAWARASHAASAEQWLALVSGSSESVARETLLTAERLDDLPNTAERLRAGKLSMAQAAQVSAGASVDPTAESGLLRVARKSGMRELRKAKERVVAAATDEQAAHELAVRERHVRTWTRGAATHGSFSGPTEEVAVVLAALAPLEQHVFAEARTADRREPTDAYRFDALVRLARGAGDCSPTEVKRTKPVVRVRVDLDALRRGHTEPGEVCEIPGVGPVAVSHAQGILGDDGLLELVVTDGVDVQSVVSTTRHFPPALAIAIDERDQACKAEGCDNDRNLERHHVEGFAEGGPTSYANTGKLCPVHHDLVTYEGYTIEINPDGSWRLRAPPQTDAA